MQNIYTPSIVTLAEQNGNYNKEVKRHSTAIGESLIHHQPTIEKKKTLIIFYHLAMKVHACIYAFN